MNRASVNRASDKNKPYAAVIPPAKARGPAAQMPCPGQPLPFTPSVIFNNSIPTCTSLPPTVVLQVPAPSRRPLMPAQDLEELFRFEVLKMLKAEGKITDAIIAIAQSG